MDAQHASRLEKTIHDCDNLLQRFAAAGISDDTPLVTIIKGLRAETLRDLEAVYQRFRQDRAGQGRPSADP